MKRLVFVIMVLPLLATIWTPAMAQDDEDLKKHPGYVDFEGIEIPGDAEETVEVYVRGPLLKLVAKATDREDPALSDLLSKLLLVRVNTFSLDRAVEGDLKQKILKIESELNKKKWEKVVRVKERDELANIYLKMENDNIVGLVVMSIEEGQEAVFVNIVGEIDMDAIGRLGRKFDVPHLEDLEKKDIKG